MIHVLFDIIYILGNKAVLLEYVIEKITSCNQVNQFKKSVVSRNIILQDT